MYISQQTVNPFPLSDLLDRSQYKSTFEKQYHRNGSSKLYFQHHLFERTFNKFSHGFPPSGSLVVVFKVNGNSESQKSNISTLQDLTF